MTGVEKNIDKIRGEWWRRNLWYISWPFFCYKSIQKKGAASTQSFTWHSRPELLNLPRGKTTPTGVLDMKLNNLMVKLQQSRALGNAAYSFMVGWLVGWILWHINFCRSFNSKFCLYIHTYSTKDFKTNIKVGRIFF